MLTTNSSFPMNYGGCSNPFSCFFSFSLFSSFFIFFSSFPLAEAFFFSIWVESVDSVEVLDDKMNLFSSVISFEDITALGDGPAAGGAGPVLQHEDNFTCSTRDMKS